ncbi:MAG: hypothetical protein C0423_07760 [Methylibium sp.]|nr:hypothetical protein [Methylibium sp.]
MPTALRALPVLAGQKKALAIKPGLESLFAVITSRLLLREEKQGTITLRLSFRINFSRAVLRASLREVA